MTTDPDNTPCSEPEPCAAHPRRLPGRPFRRRDPAAMKWEVTEENLGELHHFSFTSQLCAWLAKTEATILKIELIQLEDVNDVAFFGTPVVTHATFEDKALADLLVLLRR